MKDSTLQKIFLCSGLQSGGTSIISWCFLQRPDMDGVFDMENSVIHTDFALIKTRYIWVKMTIGSFRTTDVTDIYADMGFEVKPLLVIRDVRVAFSSLTSKIYGRNGNTAGNPPLRLRYRRFLEDWMYFKEKNLPILSFEKFVLNPEKELKVLTEVLGLQWHDSVLKWPKPESALSYTSQGNETFRLSRSDNTGLLETLLSAKATTPNRLISDYDLEWLEDTFRQYNSVNGYPEHIDGISGQKQHKYTHRFEINVSNWDQLSKRELYENYEIVSSKLDRIRRHIIFGPLIRLWSWIINKNFNVLQ